MAEIYTCRMTKTMTFDIKANSMEEAQDWCATHDFEDVQKQVHTGMLTILKVFQNLKMMDMSQQILVNRMERIVGLMRLHLFWLDKNWKKRGDCANNYNLSLIHI